MIGRSGLGKVQLVFLNSYDAPLDRRMTVWNWSVDTEDWKAQGSGDQYWIDRIRSRAEDGASQPHPVILLHNQVVGNPATVVPRCAWAPPDHSSALVLTCQQRRA